MPTLEYTDVLATVPPATHGKAEIRHDMPSDFERLRARIAGMPLERKSYVRLLVNGNCMMTDAEFERRTNHGICWNAKGHCLVAGLGIGLILDPLVKKCESVTVVEVNPDVIALVAPRFPKVNVIHADIFDWAPSKGTKYQTIYFDIWPHFNGDTNAEAAKLHKRFRKYLTTGGYMESWTRIACKAMGIR